MTEFRDVLKNFNNIEQGSLVVFNTDTKKGDEAYYLSATDKGILVINRSGYVALKPFHSFTEMVVPSVAVSKELLEELKKR